MTYNPRTPQISSGGAAAFGCLGCLLYVGYLLAILAFIGAAVWVVVYVLQWQGVL